jgi:hypothetical protein
MASLASRMAELRSIIELALGGLALVSGQFRGFVHKKHSYVICDPVLLWERDSLRYGLTEYAFAFSCSLKALAFLTCVAALCLRVRA